MGNIELGKEPVTIRDIKALRIPARDRAEKLITECEKQGLKIIITQTLRTSEAQKEYYSWGRTKLNPYTNKMTKVTNADGTKIKSKHQLGAAFDICIGIRGREYDTILLRRAGRIGMDLGLIWGGTWASFMDMPHFEMDIKSSELSDMQKNNDNIIKENPLRNNSAAEDIARNSDVSDNPDRSKDLSDSDKKRYTVSIEDKDIKVDDIIITAKTVMIENRNFIRLMDLEKADIKVSWDNISKMPAISTKRADEI